MLVTRARCRLDARACWCSWPAARSGRSRAGCWQWAEAAGAECLEVSEAVLAKLAAKDNPQTMLGVFEQRWAESRRPTGVAGDAVWVALEGMRDPGNLGTIIRTADAVGAERRPADRQLLRSLFARGRARQHGLDLQRAAGAHWRRRRSWLGPRPGAATSSARTSTRREDFRAVRYRAPTLLVMGSEGPGLSPALAAACSRLVKIPMAGRLDSLNLAVATALMLYEIRRRAVALSPSGL